MGALVSVKHCYEGAATPLFFSIVPLFALQTMHRPYEGHREDSYLAKLEADRQAQHSGYGVQQYLCADGSTKWEAYGWERTTALSIHTTSYGLFDHKWQAEQFFNNCING
jgi:hypothetical protein